MATISPFKALRPSTQKARDVASRPYDVMNRDEAATILASAPQSFLRVTRPDGLMDADTDAHDPAVYRRGRQELEAMLEEGLLAEDGAPGFYLYELTWQGKAQTGFVFLASVQDYEENLVRKHELTRPDKEDDRVEHMKILGVQSGTVFLCHRPHQDLSEIARAAKDQAPIFDFEAEDGVRHRGWLLDAQTHGRVEKAFDELGPIYIADGHHRSAAAARVCDEGFLSVSFPIDEVRILPYNRYVADLGGLSVQSLLEKLGSQWKVSEGKTGMLARHQVGMYLDGRWYTLEAKNVDETDPIASLDVELLQSRLLAPLLGIGDPRRDTRIRFVGGVRGDGTLKELVDEGGGVAFSMYPTSLDELLRVADAEAIMPPKSTWFEPKLRDGLFVHRFASS